MGITYNPLLGSGLDFTGSGASAAFFGNPVATEADLPATGNDGELRVAKDTDKTYIWDNTSSQWIDTGITAAAFGSTPNANGFTLSTSDVGNIRYRTFILQPANATNPGGVSTTTQTFAGQKTFISEIRADGGLDVTPTGGTDTLLIGATNADVITIGNSSSTINFNGTVNNNNVTNLNVTDKLITINDGGGAASGSDSGLEIEESASITGYFKTNAARTGFRTKAPASDGEILFKPTTAAQIGTLDYAALTADRTHTLPDETGTIALANSANAGFVLKSGDTMTGTLTLSNATPLNISTLTASRPLKLDASKNAISSQIDLSSTNDVTNRLGLSNFALGTANYVLIGQGLSDSSYALIANANVDASAAIARTKLASGTAHTILVNNGSGVMAEASALTNGQLLIGSTGAAPVAATLTGTTDQISVSTGAGSITLSTPQSIATTSSPTFAGLTLTAFSGVVKASAGVLSASAIVNADVDAAAAIARTKLASGTAYRVVTNNATGVMTDAAAITADRALISDANGIPTHSTVTTTELGYVSSVTGPIQSQINNKVNKAGDTMTDNLIMDNQKEVRFRELTGNGTEYVGLSAPSAIATSYTVTLPDAAPSSGQFLKASSATALMWESFSNISHSSLANLSADDHTQYALLAGRSGGQTLNGDTASGGNLTLFSTAHATKGKIILGTASAYDEANDRLGIGTTSPTVKLDVRGTTYISGATDTTTVIINGASGQGQPLQSWKTFAGTLLGSFSVGGVLTLAASDSNTITGYTPTVSAEGGLRGFKNSGSAPLVLEGSGAAGTYGGVVDGYASRGSTSSPTATQSGDTLLRLRAFGYGATAYTTTARSSISMSATENWTDSAQGSKIDIATTATGGTTTATRVTINNDGRVDFAKSTANLRRDESSSATLNALSSDQTNVKLTATVTTINGITGATDGKQIIIHNDTGSSVTLSHESGSATAAERLKLPGGADILLQDDCTIQLIYDAGASRWILASARDASLERVVNSRSSGLSISAATAITPLAGINQTQFVVGNGGAVTVTATPPVTTTNMIVGQKLTIIGTSDTNTVTYTSGNNLVLNGNITLGKDDILTLEYLGSDGSNAAWVEVSRNN